MWVVYALISAVGLGLISLLLTYLSRKNIATLTINTYFWALTASIFFLSSLVTSTKLKIQASFIKWFVLLAVIGSITHFFAVKAFQTGPNTGIVRAVETTSIMVATLGAIYFFHQGITVRNGLGMAFVVIGVILLVNR